MSDEYNPLFVEAFLGAIERDSEYVNTVLASLTEHDRSQIAAAAFWLNRYIDNHFFDKTSMVSTPDEVSDDE